MNVLLLLMGGRGERFGGSVPKQFTTIPFEGKEFPLYLVTATKLLRALPIDACILVASRQFSKQVKNSLADIQREFPDRKISVAAAGATRFASFLNGVRAAEKLPRLERIVVHDASRPYLNPDFLQRVSQMMGLLSEDTPVFIPAIPVVDSVVRRDHRRAVCYERRDELAFVQTPQLIHYPTFRAAHENALARGQIQMDFTDEGSFSLSLGLTVALFEGDPENKKITYPHDLDVQKYQLSTGIDKNRASQD